MQRQWCRLFGHEWSSWRDCTIVEFRGYGPGTFPRSIGRARTCRRCGDDQIQDCVNVNCRCVTTVKIPDGSLPDGKGPSGPEKHDGKPRTKGRG
ncbi:MAG: hypothetical protein ABEN55_20315 [Bradymonadaceae bacterium]